MKRRPAREFHQPRSLREEIWNLPNVLTLGRIIVIPLVVWLMVQGTPRTAFLATLLFSAAAITDFLDGWIARNRGLVSLWGKFLDPVADKLIVMATTVTLVALGNLPAWLVVLLLARETAVTSLRGMAQQEGLVIEVIQSGKWKTAFQLCGLVMLLVGYDYEIDYLVWKGVVHFMDAGQLMLLGSVGFSLISAVTYFKSFFVAIEEREQYEKRPRKPRRPRFRPGVGLLAASRAFIAARRRRRGRSRPAPKETP